MGSLNFGVPAKIGASGETSVRVSLRERHDQTLSVGETGNTVSRLNVFYS